MNNLNFDDPELQFPVDRVFLQLRKSLAHMLHLLNPHPLGRGSPLTSSRPRSFHTYSERLVTLVKCFAEGSADEVCAMCAKSELRLLEFLRSGSESSPPAEHASKALAGMPELTADDATRRGSELLFVEHRGFFHWRTEMGSMKKIELGGG